MTDWAQYGWSNRHLAEAYYALGKAYLEGDAAKTLADICEQIDALDETLKGVSDDK